MTYLIAFIATFAIGFAVIKLFLDRKPPKKYSFPADVPDEDDVSDTITVPADEQVHHASSFFR